MSELGEIIAPPRGHKNESINCPFCPEEPPPKFVTFRGSDNNPDTLGKNLNDPDGFANARESSARPKTNGPNEQPKITASEKRKMKEPVPIHTDSTHGVYTCQAHHLISGNQALGASGHDFENWICEGKKIKADTGYSVNNPHNGKWLPSVPAKYDGKWGKKKGFFTDDDRLTIATIVMKAKKMQFHCGPHNISDEDTVVHKTYDGYLKGMLKKMNDRMHGWAKECYLCKTESGNQKKKLQPSVRVNAALDRLSAVALRHITGSRISWDIFISAQARDYHKPVCKHKKITT